MSILVKFGRSLLATGAVVGLSLSPKPARATLGADVATVATNQQHLGGVRQVRALASGERHDLQLPSGVVVHEYVAPGGAVYAVTWRGPRVPDLRELLGSYFAQLAQRDARPWTGHHRMTMVGSDLVMQSSGHQRAFEGRAWVPSLVPVGINVDTFVE